MRLLPGHATDLAHPVGCGIAAIPGLIDSHSHAGHRLVRSLGAGDGKAWYEACAESC